MPAPARIAPPLFAAADDNLGATIYGKANVTVARTDDGADKTWELLTPV
ncbi:MAG: hypothetical protein ACE5FI_12260 [Anaerolineales bacterium]